MLVVDGGDIDRDAYCFHGELIIPTFTMTFHSSTHENLFMYENVLAVTSTVSN